jgi:hypothetical protein
MTIPRAPPREGSLARPPPRCPPVEPRPRRRAPAPLSARPRSARVVSSSGSPRRRWRSATKRSVLARALVSPGCSVRDPCRDEAQRFLSLGHPVIEVEDDSLPRLRGRSAAREDLCEGASDCVARLRVGRDVERLEEHIVGDVPVRSGQCGTARGEANAGAGEGGRGTPEVGVPLTPSFSSRWCSSR